MRLPAFNGFDTDQKTGKKRFSGTAFINALLKSKHNQFEECFEHDMLNNPYS